ncbi:MAG: RNA polymerase subunit sigma-70 [Thermoleophilia bacterium]
MSEATPQPVVFEELVERHRAELHAHCYRMLGSPHDADDALQDALLRAWRAIDGLRDARRARAWLYRIATNACLDQAEGRRRRVLPMDLAAAGDAPLPGSTWIEPYPDDPALAALPQPPEARYEQREALELAFVAALQHLPGRQRAILILRDVLGFSAREAAEAVDATEAAVNSALQRARATIERRAPAESQQLTLRRIGDRGVRELTRRFVEAFECGDVEGVVALLTDDVLFAMPPYPQWSEGREAVSRSWLMPGEPEAGRLRYLATTANGQPAFGVYVRDAAGRRYRALALDVLSLSADGRISAVVAFRGAELFPLFDLPDELPA